MTMTSLMLITLTVAVYVGLLFVIWRLEEEENENLR
jgi:hypothetical protein